MPDKLLPWDSYTLRAVKANEVEHFPSHVVAEWRDKQGRRCTAIVASCNASEAPNDDMAALFAAAPALYKALLEILVAGELESTNGQRYFEARRDGLAALGMAYPRGK